MKKAGRSDCPIGLALDIVGDRWSLLILRDVLMSGKTRYQEFLRSREGIATNVLAERLARLVDEGILTKARDPDNGKQFIYSPTQKALDLLPVLREMIRWGLEHLPQATTNRVIEAMMADEQQFRENIRRLHQLPPEPTQRHVDRAERPDPPR